jgi:hypothetical protein
MYPIYINRANPKKRGRQPPEHGKPLDCAWCLEPVKLVGTRLRCSVPPCTWGYELKVWPTSSTPSRS